MRAQGGAPRRGSGHPALPLRATPPSTAQAARASHLFYLLLACCQAYCDTCLFFNQVRARGSDRDPGRGSVGHLTRERRMASTWCARRPLVSRKPPTHVRPPWLSGGLVSSHDPRTIPLRTCCRTPRHDKNETAASYLHKPGQIFLARKPNINSISSFCIRGFERGGIRSRSVRMATDTCYS